LRTARLQQRLGHKRLARRTGIDRRHLSRIERGLRRPSLTTAMLISQALRLERDFEWWLVSEAAFNTGRDRARHNGGAQ
jgi:transcriptional regulator with XRE-family HTH domain